MQNLNPVSGCWKIGSNLIRLNVILCSVLCFLATSSTVFAAVNYQGRLLHSGRPAEGVFDLRFSLWNSLTNGNRVGTVVEATNVTVSGGVFSVGLDFGTNAFDGSQRWIEMGVRTNQATTSYSTLSPRQAVRPAPYALYAMTPAGPPGPPGETGPPGSPTTASNSLFIGSDHMRAMSGSTVSIG